MEDADIAVTNFGGDPDALLLGVFDGHGGSEVSFYCQKYFASVLLAEPAFAAGDLPAALRSSFLRLDEMISNPQGLAALDTMLLAAEESHETHDDDPSSLRDDAPHAAPGPLHEVDKFSHLPTAAGSTAVVALLRGGSVTVANAGDSRCLLSRKGVFVALSDDHKPNNDIEYQRITKAGGVVTRDNRVQGSLALSRALGDFEFKANQALSAEEQMVTALPDIMSEQIRDAEDEFLVLACDGLFEIHNWQSLLSLVRDFILRGLSMVQVIEATLDASVAPALGAPGSDNMTMQIILLPTTACRQLLEQAALNKAQEEAMRAQAAIDAAAVSEIADNEFSENPESLRASDNTSDSLPSSRTKRTIEEIE